MFESTTFVSALLLVSTAGAAVIERSAFAAPAAPWGSIAKAAVAERSTNAKPPSYSPSFKGPTTGNQSFSLETIAYAGDLSLSGMFPVELHSGAGDAWLNAQYINSGNRGWSFNTTTGDIFYGLNVNSFTPTPFCVGFNGFPDMAVEDTIPTGYKFMGTSPGWANAGFSFDPTTNEVIHRSYKGRSLAVCPFLPYIGGEPRNALMWRDASTPKNSTCAEVTLKALIGGSST